MRQTPVFEPSLLVGLPVFPREEHVRQKRDETRDKSYELSSNSSSARARGRASITFAPLPLRAADSALETLNLGSDPMASMEQELVWELDVIHRRSKKTESATDPSLYTNGQPSTVPSEQLFCKAMESEIVGCVTYAPGGSGWAVIAREGEVEIRMLAVTSQGSVARALVKQVIKLAREEARISVVALLPTTSREAKTFYSHLGFKRMKHRDQEDPSSGKVLRAYIYDLLIDASRQDLR